MVDFGSANTSKMAKRGARRGGKMAKRGGYTTNGIEMNPLWNDDGAVPDMSIGPVGAALLPGPLTVAYITDVEGNYEYFKRCIDQSAIISFAPGSFVAGTTGASAAHLTDEAKLVLAKDGGFVFGGDLFDKVWSRLKLNRHTIHAP